MYTVQCMYTAESKGIQIKLIQKYSCQQGKTIKKFCKWDIVLHFPPLMKASIDMVEWWRGEQFSLIQKEPHMILIKILFLPGKNRPKPIRGGNARPRLQIQQNRIMLQTTTLYPLSWLRSYHRYYQIRRGFCWVDYSHSIKGNLIISCIIYKLSCPEPSVLPVLPRLPIDKLKCTSETSCSSSLK